MEIKINEADIQEHINKVSAEAVKAAFDSYDMKKAIGETIANQVTEGKIAEAITKALASLDLDDMGKAIAREIMRVTVKGTHAVLAETMTDVILKIRGIASFQPEYKAEKEKLFNRLFKGGERT